MSRSLLGCVLRDVERAVKQGISPKKLAKLQGKIAVAYNRGKIDKEHMGRLQSEAARAAPQPEPKKKAVTVSRPGPDKRERRQYDRDPEQSRPPFTNLPEHLLKER